MTLYPSNNNTSLQPTQPSVAGPVHFDNKVDISATVKEKKTSKHSLFFYDAQIVCKNAVRNVIIPGLMQTIYNGAMNTLSGILLGKNNSQTMTGMMQSNVVQPLMNYGNMYGQQMVQQASSNLFRVDDRRFMDDIYVANEAEAQLITGNLINEINTKGRGFVAQVKEQIKINGQPMPITDADWMLGWTSTNGIGYSTTVDGVKIVLPPAQKITQIIR